MDCRVKPGNDDSPEAGADLLLLTNSCEKIPRQPLRIVLAREIPLLDEGPERADRHFSGAVGGAATDLGQGPGRRSPEGPVRGSNPSAGCCMAAQSHPRPRHGMVTEEWASWGTYNAARGAWRRHYLICEAFFRRSAPSKEGNRRPAAPARLFDSLGPRGRGTMKRVRRRRSSLPLVAGAQELVEQADAVAGAPGLV